MKLTEDQRQALGEALTQHLASYFPPGEDGHPDWFDSRNMDLIIDVIEDALPAGVKVLDGGQHG